MAQLSYSQQFGKAYEGQIADDSPCTIDSFRAGGAIVYGRGVIRGANDSTVVIAAASGLLKGVAVRNHQLPSEGDVVANDMVSVLRKGRVFGEVAVNVTAEQQAYVVTAVGADQGKFTNVSTNNLLAGRFLTAGNDGDLVKIAVDFV